MPNLDASDTKSTDSAVGADALEPDAAKPVSDASGKELKWMVCPEDGPPDQPAPEGFCCCWFSPGIPSCHD